MQATDEQQKCVRRKLLSPLDITGDQGRPTKSPLEFRTAVAQSVGAAWDCSRPTRPSAVRRSLPGLSVARVKNLSDSREVGRPIQLLRLNQTYLAPASGRIINVRRARTQSKCKNLKKANDETTNNCRSLLSESIRFNSKRTGINCVRCSSSRVTAKLANKLTDRKPHTERKR